MAIGHLNTWIISLYFASFLICLVLGIGDTMLKSSIELAQTNIIDELVTAGSTYDKNWESFIDHEIFSLVPVIDLVNWIFIFFVAWAMSYAFKFGWSINSIPMGAILTRHLFSVMITIFVFSMLLIYIETVFLTQIIGPLYAYIWDELWAPQFFVYYVYIWLMIAHLLVIIGNRIRHASIVQVKKA